MTVSMYVGISVCVLVLYILHRIDKNDEKARQVKRVRKPDLDSMYRKTSDDIDMLHRKSVDEITQMYRDSLEKLKEEV